MEATRRGILSGLALAAAVAMGSPALAQSVEEFYSGKALTMLVSAPAGSLTDIVAGRSRHTTPSTSRAIPRWWS